MKIGERFNPFRKANGTFIPEHICELPLKELSFGAKVVYGRLMRYCGRNGVANPRRKTLAQEVGCRTRQLDKYIRELKDAKLIETEKLYARGSSNYYFLFSTHWNNYLAEEGTDLRDSAALDLQDSATPKLRNSASLTIEESHYKRVNYQEYTTGVELSEKGNANKRKYTDEVREIAVYFREKISPSERVSPEAEKAIKARLYEFSKPQLLEAIDGFSKNKWRMAHNAGNGIPWFFKDETQIAKWLMMAKSQHKWYVPP